MGTALRASRSTWVRERAAARRKRDDDRPCSCAPADQGRRRLGRLPAATWAGGQPASVEDDLVAPGPGVAAGAGWPLGGRAVAVHRNGYQQLLRDLADDESSRARFVATLGRPRPLHPGACAARRIRQRRRRACTRSRAPCRRSRDRCVRAAGGITVRHNQSQRLFDLNHTASIVLRLCDGTPDGRRHRDRTRGRLCARRPSDCRGRRLCPGSAGRRHHHRRHALRGQRRRSTGGHRLTVSRRGRGCARRYFTCVPAPTYRPTGPLRALRRDLGLRGRGLAHVTVRADSARRANRDRSARRARACGTIIERSVAVDGDARGPGVHGSAPADRAAAEHALRRGGRGRHLWIRHRRAHSRTPARSSADVCHSAAAAWLPLSVRARRVRMRGVVPNALQCGAVHTSVAHRVRLHGSSRMREASDTTSRGHRSRRRLGWSDGSRRPVHAPDSKPVARSTRHHSRHAESGSDPSERIRIHIQSRPADR